MCPPTTFGVLRRPKVGLPGSMRSGEKARWKSRPTTSPVRDRIGSTTSSVVPGQVVDSSTTSVPGRSRAAMASVAPMTALRSGLWSASSGVGTQITTVSASASTLASSVARKPQVSSSCTRASEMSSTCE